MAGPIFCPQTSFQVQFSVHRLHSRSNLLSIDLIHPGSDLLSTGFIPGPIFFGSVIDSTCVLWQTACGKTGACLFYDTNRFRYNIFGFSLLFQAFSTVSCFGLLIAVKRRVARQKLLDEQNALVVTASTQDEKCVLVEQISGV